MSSVPSVPARNPVIAARVDKINGNFYVPDETSTALENIKQAGYEFASKIEKICTQSGIAFDIGRVIAAIDGIQSVTHIASEAITLPYHAARK